MLFTFVLLGFVNSSCLTRNFEDCLTLNVEYQESCQLSQGECRPRPEKCTEIDATYPLNCRTNECYYSKRFNKCLSQPFTRILNEVADRGDHEDHQQDSHDGPDHSESGDTEGGPLPPPNQPPQYPPNPSYQPTQNQTTQNNSTMDQPQEQENETNDQEDEQVQEEDQVGQDDNENTNDDQPWNEPDVSPSTNSTNSTNSSNNSNSTDGFNDTYYGFQNLIEEEIKVKLSESDNRKQIEIKSSGTCQLIMAFVTMIIWI